MARTRREAAIDYAGRGWHVIPLRDHKSKQPVIEGWQNKATDDVEQVLVAPHAPAEGVGDHQGDRPHPRHEDADPKELGHSWGRELEDPEDRGETERILIILAEWVRGLSARGG